MTHSIPSMGIMGAGNIGVAFANTLAKKSIRVVLSNIRDQAIQDESLISSEEAFAFVHAKPRVPGARVMEASNRLTPP